MSKIISIEGNIGSGKSTIVSNLKKYSASNYIFVEEPVKEWSTICDEVGETILSHFYRDSKQYSFQFQMMAYISRLNTLRTIVKNNPDSIIITERCLFTDRNVFAKMLYDSGNMTKIEYTIYNKWFDAFIEDVSIDGIIYVDTNPEICNRRIHLRNRNGESIPLNYLEKCHKYHKEWLNTTATPVKVYDGNKTVNQDNMVQCMKTIDMKIRELLVEETTNQYEE